MGILDEAIREHLELKRQHGAGDSELQQLEDQAFGQAERPGDEAPSDAAAEAPTEFMAQPETPAEPSGRREPPTIADLQEPPPPPAEEPAPAAEEEPDSPAPDIESAGPTTEERQAIAEQPTELHDIEPELAAESPRPTDEELVEEEIAEPRLAPADPLADFDEDEEAEVSVQGPAPDDDDELEDEDDAFWNEQRLSDELDQALEAPRDDEPELAEEPESEEAPAAPRVAEIEDEEPEAVRGPEPDTKRHEDVLEDTPDFLEETPEDDQLWFEQKPPKDFDFDD
ncbi:MAG TPA: hypothetical protein VID51_08425 [Solirubrobacterales bacterium]|jgi:hypothetical protein